MTLEATPASVQSDGKWRITFVASGDNPLSVADLLTGDVITYGFTADGFNWSSTQAPAEDKRLTLVQDLTRPGRLTETLEVKYVRSATSGSADDVLTGGVEGFLTVRRAVDNATAPTIGQEVDVISFVAGVKRPDAPVENGVDTISQTLFITAPTVRGGTLVA